MTPNKKALDNKSPNNKAPNNKAPNPKAPIKQKAPKKRYYIDRNSTVEQLPPTPLVLLLTNYRNRLLQLHSVKEQVLKNAPAGTLIINKNKGHLQYYCKDARTNTTRYIQKRHLEEVEQLAQKEYNKKVLVRLQTQIQQLEKTIEMLQKNDLLTVYDNLPESRQKLVEPVTLPGPEYVRRWLAIPYEHKPFAEGSVVHLTSSGLQVRSKSEVLIAETLTRLGIPFRYEYPVTLGKVTLHPDFYCLNVATRQEVVWEHFGMLDEQDYFTNAVDKQNLYIQHGFIPGKKLIFTMESLENPLTLPAIEAVARAHFL